MEEKDVLRYKNYRSRVTYDKELHVLRGHIEGLSEEVGYICTDVDEVEAVFQQTVDDYIARCKREGRPPDREYKGCFNVRIHPGYHRQLALLAYEHPWETINSLVERAVQEFLDQEYVPGWEKTRYI